MPAVRISASFHFDLFVRLFPNERTYERANREGRTNLINRKIPVSANLSMIRPRFPERRALRIGAIKTSILHPSGALTLGSWEWDRPIDRFHRSEDGEIGAVKKSFATTVDHQRRFANSVRPSERAPQRALRITWAKL